jgi:Phosphoglucose isomerase
MPPAPRSPTAATRFADSLSITTGALESEVSRATARLEERRFRHALFARRSDAWSRDADIQRTIANRLGWLALPAAMARELPRLSTFADGVVRDAFTDVVLLGMGGSSLAPEVLRAVVGVRPGRPRFTMVDSVNPDHLRTITSDPHRSLYVLASKSGSTIEPNVLAAYFRQRLLDAGISRWGAHFVAITDPGTALDTRATAEGFREVFRNPPDIGGRYSAGCRPMSEADRRVGSTERRSRGWPDRHARRAEVIWVATGRDQVRPTSYRTSSAVTLSLAFRSSAASISCSATS